MPLSHSDVRRILEILDAAENISSLTISVGEFELHASKPGAEPAHAHSAERRPAVATSAPTAAGPDNAASGAAADSASQQFSDAIPEGLVAVRAPMVGTFYSRPSPDQPPFVTCGEAVEPDDQVCLVEVMKLFNAVQAGVAGTVERILVGDGKPVKHDQVLMLIRPQAIS